MFRRILNNVLLLVVLVGIAWMAWTFLRDTSKGKLPLDAVPANAALVIEGKDIVAYYRHLDNTSLLWQDIKISGLLTNLDAQLANWHRLSEKKLIPPSAHGNPFALSLHIDGIKMQTLLAVKLGGLSEEELIASFEKAKVTVSKENSIGETQVYSMKEGNRNLIFCVKEDLFISTSDKGVLELSLSNIAKGTALFSDENFRKIASTAGDHAHANIYLRNDVLFSYLSAWLNPSLREMIENNTTGPDSYFDLYIEPDALVMNGFTSANSKTPSVLQLFNGQKPIAPEIQKWLPENTEEYFYTGLSDVDLYRKKLKEYNPEHENEINEFNTAYQCDLEQHLLSWAGNEFIYFKVKNANAKFLIVKTDEGKNPQNELNYLATHLDSSGKENININGVIIRRLDADDLFGLTMGELFSDIDRPYYLNVENMVVFCTDITAMEEYIKNISNEKLLIRNMDYYDAMHRYFSSEANLIYHLEGANIISKLDSTYAMFAGTQNWISNIASFTWQINVAKENTFYNNGLLQYRKSGNASVSTIWEVPLDTLVNAIPQIIPNHMNGTQNIIVQDADYNLYSISSTGKIEWRKSLEEKMVGGIQRVDILHNGKNQIFFATSSQLHLIDLKGNYVSGFPVNINKTITATPAAFDYEMDGKYRFIVPCGRELLNYDKEGKLVTGFKFTPFAAEIIQTPVFFRVENKDYIFVCDAEGNVNIIDRKGQTRYPVKFRLNNRSRNDVFLEPGTTVETSRLVFSANNGTVYRYYLNGTKDSLETVKTKTSAGLWYMDIDMDGSRDFICVDSSKIKGFGHDKKIKFSFSTDCADYQLRAFNIGSGQFLVGGSCMENEKIFAISHSGESLVLPSLYADTPFTVADLNKDGRYELVYTFRNRLFVYSLR